MTSTMVQARCAVHPERVAEGACKRCGDYACAECNLGDLAAGTLCAKCASVSAESRYHVVPLGRFVLFSVLTYNVYALYWFWKNWTLVKRRDGSEIWPAARAFFGGLTYFWLLSDINTQLAMRGSSRRLSVWLAIGFLISSSLYRLPNPYDLLVLFSCVFLVPSVISIRELASSGAIRAAAWSTRHTVAVVLSGIFFAMVLVGSFLPEE